MRRVVSIFEKSFGGNHPNVATALNNLAQLLKSTNRMSEAEPLMRRALAIDELSFGPDHPDVATDLNNLAQLLKSTNRLSEAEPLMKRMVEIFLQFTRATGHAHPHLPTAVANYTALLQEMEWDEDEIRVTLDEMGQRYGVDLRGVSGRGTGDEPSPKLRAFIGEIIQDQSKFEEIIERVQHEDPELFMEFVEWYERVKGGSVDQRRHISGFE